MPGLRGKPAVMMTMSARGGLVVVGAGDGDVVAFDRTRLEDVEAFTLGDAFHDVDQNHIGEFLEASQVSKRATDLAGADQCNLVSFRAGDFPEKGR